MTRYELCDIISFISRRYPSSYRLTGNFTSALYRYYDCCEYSGHYLGGYVSCSGGPTLVGMVSVALGDSLKMGIGTGIIFPIVLLIGIGLCKEYKKRKRGKKDELFEM